MLEKVKEDVCVANKLLRDYRLVISTWGNVSQYDTESQLVVIKPSGVEYDLLTPDKMVVVDLEGNIVQGQLKPSSDTMTHLEIYKHFSNIKSIVHTHSTWATIWAQIGEDIPVLGTTHADDFFGSIPCTRTMTDAEIDEDYEKNTGKVIAEKMNELDYYKIYAVLVNQHGPFVFEKKPYDAVKKAMVLEQVAKMAWFTCNYKSGFTQPISSSLLKKHFERKVGDNAYYGQE